MSSAVKSIPVRAAFVFISLAAGMVIQGCKSGDRDLKLTSVSPDRVSARGGETLTVEGEGFKSGVVLYLGDKPLVVVDSTPDIITAITPVLTAGVYDLTVTIPGEESVEIAEAVEVEALSLNFREAAAHYLPDIGDAVITDVVAADLDGDGAVDILLGVSGGQSRFLLNDGAGLFRDTDPDPEQGPGLPVFEQDTRAILTADFDGDGHPDIFGCSGSGEPNRLLMNDGAGRFSDADVLPNRVGSCLAAATADLTGDGLLDIAVIAAKEGIDDVQFLRVYRNLSSPGNPLFAIDEDIEPRIMPEEESVGWTWSEGDPEHSAAFTISHNDPASGRGCGEAVYDFAGVEGYMLFSLYAPGINFTPDELRLRLKGDGSGHLLSLRIRDLSGQRFVREIGPLENTEWTLISAADINEWDYWGGNEDGVVDLPIDRVTLQIDRTDGGPEQGVLRVDDVELFHQTCGVAVVEDFERSEPVHGFSGDIFSSISIADLNSDGTADLVLTTVASPTGEFLRVLLNRRTVDADDPSVLRFVQEPVLSPPGPVSFSVVLDMESDGDMDLLLLTQGQNRVFINDGNAHFFDDTTSTLPVDRTDSLRAVTGDLNLDGFTDVVIANYGQADRLYLGSAEGRMLDFTPSLGLEVASTRFAVILDADGDNVPDIFMVNDDTPGLRLFISVD